MPDEIPDLSRRTLLASMSALGVGGALGVHGTRELFAGDRSTTTRLPPPPTDLGTSGDATTGNGPESGDGTTTAAGSATTTGEATTDGSLDLLLDWWVFHRSRRTADHRQEPTDAPGPVVSLCDVKPGDYGGGCIGVRVAGTPAWVWASGTLCSSAENGQNEPERETEGDDTDGRGELADALRFAVVPLGHCDQCDGRTAAAAREFVRNADPERTGLASESRFPFSGEPPVAGSLRETLKSLDGGHLLDDWARNGTTGDCLHPSNTYYLGFLWWLPLGVGNEIQSDSVEFALEFGAVQCRRGEDPARYNPFADDDS